MDSHSAVQSSELTDRKKLHVVSDGDHLGLGSVRLYFEPLENRLGAPVEQSVHGRVDHREDMRRPEFVSGNEDLTLEDSIMEDEDMNPARDKTHLVVMLLHISISRKRRTENRRCTPRPEPRRPCGHGRSPCSR